MTDAMPKVSMAGKDRRESVNILKNAIGSANYIAGGTANVPIQFKIVNVDSRGRITLGDAAKYTRYQRRLYADGTIELVPVNPV